MYPSPQDPAGPMAVLSRCLDTVALSGEGGILEAELWAAAVSLHGADYPGGGMAALLAQAAIQTMVARSLASHPEITVGGGGAGGVGGGAGRRFFASKTLRYRCLGMVTSEQGRFICIRTHNPNANARARTTPFPHSPNERLRWPHSSLGPPSPHDVLDAGAPRAPRVRRRKVNGPSALRVCVCV